MRRFTFHAALPLAMLTGVAMAQSFDLSWRTVDGGGGASAGATFQVSGTIGQPDASAIMTGGTFELAGGFWPGAADTCGPPGDLNHDGDVDGVDAQGFINCLLTTTGSNCGCADFDGGGAGVSDVALFVSVLLAG